MCVGKGVRDVEPVVLAVHVAVDRRIDAWLRGLAKPVAVLAQNDVPARDLADRCGVSRVKLAYIVDSTAAPVVTLALVTTWIG